MNIAVKGMSNHLKCSLCFIGVLLLFNSLLLSSCGTQSDESTVLVESAGKQLTQRQFVKVLGEEFDPNNQRHKTFISRWVNEQVVVKDAAQNLPENERDFSKEIEGYHNSLLKHAWEQKIIESQLDTSITKEELQAYYNANTANFELKQNIVRARYVKVEKSHPKLNLFKYWIQYKDSATREKFLELVEKYRAFTVLNDSIWQPLEELKSLVPIKLYNDEHFLSNYRYTEAPDGEFIWIVYFVQHRLKDNVSPLNLVSDKIRNIILNKRKLAILQRHKDSILEKAKKEGEIKLNIEI